MKDKDLDILLSEYRKNQPTQLQVQKWKKAVQKERQPKPKYEFQWTQIIAASVVGFLVGAMVFYSTKNKDAFQNFAQIENDNATIEYVFTKTN